MQHLSLPYKLIYFFQRESSKDALRNILTIIVPSVIIFYWFDLHIAIGFGVGIILAALTDLPGNLKDKKLTALITIPSFFITALVTSYSVIHLPWLVILLLLVFGFICNFSLVLGPRIGVVGNLTLIVISFTIGLKPHDVIPFTLALTAGTITFFGVSMLQVIFFPKRSLKYAMDDGFENMANLIRLKVNCYNEHLPLEQVYKELSLFHIKVSEQLEIVRSLLLREKNIGQSTPQKHEVWINKIYRLIDMYELLMANDYDYETIRLKLNDTNALPLIRKILIQFAHETAKISSNKGISKSRLNNVILDEDIKALKIIIKSVEKEEAKILFSILEHIQHIKSILTSITSTEELKDPTWISHNNYKSFISSQISWKTITDNLSKGSPIFMYSLRMAILLAVAALIGYIFPGYKYASWMILTIILVARPSYIITQKRNYQRIVGSIIGLILSIIILYFIKDIPTLLVVAAITLYLFYLFNKPNYLICVIFITTAIIISLNIQEGNIFNLLGSRFVFTLLGSLFAILGCLIIPINHLKTVESVSQNLISNYKKYLTKIKESTETTVVDFYQLRLVRKNAQTSLAQFYDAIDQYIKDPRNKKTDFNIISNYETIAYRINALLIGLSVSIAKSSSSDNHTQMAMKIAKIDLLIDELDDIAHTIITSKKQSLPV